MEEKRPDPVRPADGTGPKDRFRDLFGAVFASFRKRLSRVACKRLKKILLPVAAVILAVCLLAAVFCLAVSAAVRDKTSGRICSLEELSATGETYACVLVLGCAVWRDGTPSDMLRDRVDTGVACYQAGLAPLLLMSGDHRTDAYNEVGAMKREAVSLGVPTEDIFLDHDGYSTYESIARYREIYGGGRVVIVTQEYHLYRALYLAEKCGIEAVGVPADRQTYRGQFKRDLREIVARTKDVWSGLTRPAPQVTGKPVELSGDGNRTEEQRPAG